MCRSILLLLLLLFAVCCTAQVSSSCAPGVSLKKLYANDAADIALERMYTARSPDTGLIEIPPCWQDTALGVIAAVYNAGSIYEADSVFLYYCAHRWPEYSFMTDFLGVSVDESYEWTKAWIAGKTETGNAPLDDFLRQHGVTCAVYISPTRGCSGFYNTVLLEAHHCINLRAFGDSLNQFPGVIYCGSANANRKNIYYIDSSGAHIGFRADWGDCPSGCISHKEWRYTVSLKDCTVLKDTIIVRNFIADPIRLSNCGLIPTVAPGLMPREMAMTIYPNPAHNKLLISGTTTAPLNYAIMNTIGNIVLQGVSNEHTIDISVLPVGNYFIRLTAGGQSLAVFKIKKE